MVTPGRFRAYTAIVFLLILVSTATAKYSGGSGTAQDPYQVATAADLIALGETPADCDKHFIMTADIDLDPKLPGRKVFDKAVIAPGTLVDGLFRGDPFTGVFDGNGHRILHLTIKGKDSLGLFGQLGHGGKVKNLGVVDVSITGSGNGIGGLVGDNTGTVTQCYSAGTVSGALDVGGLVGYNYGTVTECYGTGAVIGTQTSVGGLVGGNSGAVTQCYSTGAVSGENYVGGLIGTNGHPESGWGTVMDCFWDTQTSGQATSAAGTGKTTAEMQTPKTFLDAGWDFVGETANGTEDIWWIDEGNDYPRLSWEKYAGGSGTPDAPKNEYIVVAQLNLWYYGPGCYGGFEAFNCSGLRNTRLIPYLGHTYFSSDSRVIQQQIAWAADYGVDAFSLEWTTPRGTPGSLEVNIDDFFLKARSLGRIRWCIFYDFVLRLMQTPGLNVDLGGGINFDNPDVYGLFVSDFRHFAEKYFGHPQHLRIDDRPVIYVWAAANFKGNVAGAVRDARAVALTLGHDVFIAGDLVRADVFDPTLVSLFDASTTFIPFFIPGLNAGKWADVGEAVDPVDRTFTNWRGSIQGLRVAGRLNDYVRFQPAWSPQYDDRLFQQVNNGGAGRWLPAISKEQVIAIAQVARRHAQPAGNSGQKIVWLNTFNCWAETTSIEPTAASGPNYPAGNYQFDMLEVVREVFGDKTYGTP